MLFRGVILTETLLDRFNVVVSTTRGLAPLEQPLEHHLLTALQEENKLTRADRLVELGGLVHLAWETVDEESSLAVAPLGLVLIGNRVTGLGSALLLQSLSDGVGEQSHGDFHGDDLAFLDVVGNHGAVLRTGALLFGTKKVTGAEVDEAVVLDETGALRALSSTRTAKNENDGDFGSVEARGVLLSGCSSEGLGRVDGRGGSRSRSGGSIDCRV